MASNSLIDIFRDLLHEAGAQTWIPPKAGATGEPAKPGPVKDFVKQAVNNSIDHRWLLHIKYMGDAENAPGPRWIEPYVWGVHIRSGADVLRAWQYDGKTTSIQPGWKMFRMDKISGTAPLTSKTFDAPRPGYNEDDKHMSGVKNKVDFSMVASPVTPGKPGPAQPGGEEPPEGPSGTAPKKPAPKKPVAGTQAAIDQEKEKKKAMRPKSTTTTKTISSKPSTGGRTSTGKKLSEEIDSVSDLFEKTLQLAQMVETELETGVQERKSPLSDKEEHIAKHMKAALKNMQSKYGAEKGKEYFYGHIRNLANKR